MTVAAAPTGLAGRAAEWVGYQLTVHPRLRHVTMIWLCGHLLMTWAVITAPRAAAAPAIALLGFTGLTDSRGVPVSYYYLSTVNTAEKIMEGGPGLSLNPNSWVEWLSESLTTGLTYSTVAAWLQMQAALYVTMVALALWALNFVLSLQWLTFLASWFRPLFDALQLLVIDLYLFPICLAIGLAVGAFHVVFNNRMGHGWRVILSTVVIGILGFVVTRDPVSDLGSENGLLAQARRAGLDVSSAAIGNTAVAPAGTDPIKALSASLVDAMIRAPLQMFNFGTTIDSIGGCAAAWDNAIVRDRSTTAPARAMETCGALDQLAYAQQLDGSSLGVGLFFLLFGAAFTLFIVYVAYSYFMVAAAAFVNAIWLLFAAPLAMIDGAPRQRAWRRFTEFFRHAVLVAVYVMYLSFAAVIVKQISAPDGYADKIGMTSPFPKLILTALVSVAAIGVFAWLKKQLGDQVRQNLAASVRNTATAGRAGMERGQRHNARAGATMAAAKAAGAPPGPDDDSADGEALTGQPSPGRNSTGGARSGRGARIYRAAKAGVATAAAPEAVVGKAAAGVAAHAAAGAADRARPGGSAPPAATAPGVTPPATPATRSTPSAGRGIARTAGYAAAAIVPPSVARAAGYAAGLAGGSGAVTATKDRLRNGKPPTAPRPADANDVQDTLTTQTPSTPSTPPPGPPPPGSGDPADTGNEPTPGRSG